MNSAQIDEAVQAPVPGDPLPPEKEETEYKIKPLERIKLHPKAPVEPSIYGKYTNFSRSWILQDGRVCDLKGSENKDMYRVPRKRLTTEGKRKRLLTDYFWEQMLKGLMDELENTSVDEERCSEYDATYIKENFEPRDLAYSQDPTVHLKFPLYGTGSSAITFYSETLKKTDGEILEKFRRTQDFTRPIGERLDDGWVL